MSDQDKTKDKRIFKPDVILTDKDGKRPYVFIDFINDISNHPGPLHLTWSIIHAINSGMSPVRFLKKFYELSPYYSLYRDQPEIKLDLTYSEALWLRMIVEKNECEDSDLVLIGRLTDFFLDRLSSIRNQEMINDSKLINIRTTMNYGDWDPETLFMDFYFTEHEVDGGLCLDPSSSLISSQKLMDIIGYYYKDRDKQPSSVIKKQPSKEK